MGREVIHSVEFSIDDIANIDALYDIVRSWKSSSLLVDGVMRTDIDPWTALDCFNRRSRAFDPDEYCFARDDETDKNDNDFGCRRTGINLYSYYGLKGFGQMDRHGNFHVDKPRMLHMAKQNLQEYALCPALDMHKILASIESIPDIINPKRNRDWEYVTDWEDGKDIAIAVRKKRPRDAFFVLDDDGDDHTIFAVPTETARAKEPQKMGCGCGTLMVLLAGLALALITGFV